MVKNKKAISSYLLIVWSWILFIGFALLFFLLFGISLKGCGHSQATQEITSAMADDGQTNIHILTFLRTPTAVDEKEKHQITTNSDLLYFYCAETDKNLKEKYRLQFLSKSLSYFMKGTSVAKITCPDGTTQVLRGPVCSKPDLIQLPSTSGIIKLEFCEKPDRGLYDSLQITSPDGKKWVLMDKSGAIFWKEVNTENLLTQEEFEETYFYWEGPIAEAVAGADEFENKVNSAKIGEEVGAPNGAKWKKVTTSIWCMVYIPDKAISCESTMLTTEQLISSKGNVPEGTQPETYEQALNNEAQENEAS